MFAIFKREFKSYFDSMIGYVIVAFMILFVAIYFSYINLVQGSPYFGYALSNITVVFLLVIPILTMRCLSDEKKSKTDQLLLTSPTTIGKIVMGKYLGMVAVFAVPVLFMCLCPLIIGSFGTSYYLIDYMTILAFFLIGCAYIAIGMFVSSLTESQIISAVVTFGILLLLQLMSGITQFISGTAFASYVGFIIAILLFAIIFNGMTKNQVVSIIIAIVGIGVLSVFYFTNSTIFAGALAKVLNAIPLMESFYNFLYKIFDVKAIVYYISVAVVFIFLTVQSIQKRRWS